MIRGAGKQTHYEYEIRIILPDGKLNILRRYSRFRELHMSMKNIYGAKVRNYIQRFYRFKENMKFSKISKEISRKKI